MGPGGKELAAVVTEDCLELVCHRLPVEIRCRRLLLHRPHLRRFLLLRKHTASP
jgi:hypothetical protein